jgi:hypothetical protein
MRSSQLICHSAVISDEKPFQVKVQGCASDSFPALRENSIERLTKLYPGKSSFSGLGGDQALFRGTSLDLPALPTTK